MSCVAYAPAFGAIDASPVRRTARRRQSVHALVLLTIVVAVDQVTKAWAWRHASVTTINSGSTDGLGGPLNQWFSGRVTGAVLDFLDFGVICLSGFLLMRTPRARGVFVSAALMIAGWSSNLLDRLGMHMVTAPGSVRGAVDFIRIGGRNCNVADLVIASGTISFLFLIARAARGSKGIGSTRMEMRVVDGHKQRTSRRPGRWSTAAGLAIAAALCADVSMSAVHYGGVNRSEQHLVGGASSKPGSSAAPPPRTTPVEIATVLGGVVCHSISAGPVCRSPHSSADHS